MNSGGGIFPPLEKGPPGGFFNRVLNLGNMHDHDKGAIRRQVASAPRRVVLRTIKDL